MKEKQMNDSLSGKDKEDNERRLIAAEIIRSLWESKNLSQLGLLQMQINTSIKNLEKR